MWTSVYLNEHRSWIFYHHEQEIIIWLNTRFCHPPGVDRDGIFKTNLFSCLIDCHHVWKVIESGWRRSEWAVRGEWVMGKLYNTEKTQTINFLYIKRGIFGWILSTRFKLLFERRCDFWYVQFELFKLTFGWIFPTVELLLEWPVLYIWNTQIWII
jgi:hypothetical protein